MPCSLEQQVAALEAAVNKLNEALIQTVGLLRDLAAALAHSQRQMAQARTEGELAELIRQVRELTALLGRLQERLEGETGRRDGENGMSNRLPLRPLSSSALAGAEIRPPGRRSWTG